MIGGLAAFALVGTAWASTTDTSDLGNLGPDWVVYARTPVANGALRTLQVPKQPDGSCNFFFRVVLAPDQSGLDVHERAFNPVTCESIFEIGTPLQAGEEPAPATLNAGEPLEPVDTIPTPVDIPEAPTFGAELPPLPELVAIVGPARYVSSKGYYKSYYEDPVNLDVNSVRNNTEWTWRTDGNACVYNLWGAYHYGWYSPSGWELKENNWYNYATCSEHISSSYVHFRNGKFCASVDAHTYYSRNTVKGRRDGYLIGEVYAWKKGGCVRMLSFHTQLRRTQN